MPSNGLTLNSVSFAYGGHSILHDLNLSLCPGDITCLLGSSGSGKTTLLQLCAGLLDSQSGTVTSDYVRPSKDIGYMQQSGGLLPWRTVIDNITLGQELLGQKPDKAKAKDILKQVGLETKGDCLPTQLSGGQQQRVALARQLIMQPKLLLLDEPLGALDIVLRQDLAQLIKDIVKQQNIAALVVTHSPEEAIFLADQLCLLSGQPATITHRWQMGQDLSPETAFHEIVKTMHDEAIHEPA